MTGKPTGGAEALTKALGAVLEGLTFFELAHLIAADTKVKVTFEDLQRRKAAELSRLEPLAGGSAKEAAPRPGVFPVDSVARAECYVCGHVVETKAMPNQCPKCGTARYTFEKEISLARAWEIARETAAKSASLFRDSASRADARAKPVLEDLARAEDDLAREAGQELTELRS